LDNELILVSDEQPPSSWLFRSPQANLGYVVTYMPLNRITRTLIHRGTKFDTLEITLAATTTTESVSVIIPLDASAAVSRIILVDRPAN
jgi:hypothetical protein